jgi:hypothetical protein
MNPIKLTIKGVPVEVFSPEDAMRMIELSQEPGHSRPLNGNSGPHGHAENATHEPAAVDPQVVRAAIDFLKAMQSGGPAGVNSDRIITALGVPHGRAIGGRLALVNKLLEGHQLSKAQVYSNKKTAKGRVWKGRKSLEAAITALEQQLKGL